MDAKEIIARRIALELTSGNLVNLGIGLPTADVVLEGGVHAKILTAVERRE